MTCPECSAQISDSALSCPKCGCPKAVAKPPHSTAPQPHDQDPALDSDELETVRKPAEELRQRLGAYTSGYHSLNELPNILRGRNANAFEQYYSQIFRLAPIPSKGMKPERSVGLVFDGLFNPVDNDIRAEKLDIFAVVVGQETPHTSSSTRNILGNSNLEIIKGWFFDDPNDAVETITEKHMTYVRHSVSGESGLYTAYRRVGRDAAVAEFKRIISPRFNKLFSVSIMMGGSAVPFFNAWKAAFAEIKQGGGERQH